MEQLTQQVSRLLGRFDWTSVVDILILTLLIYGLLSILQGTRAEMLFRGMIIVLLAGFVLTTIWPEQLPVLRWLVTNSVQVLLVAILVIFAPEMRRALEQIGHTGDFINRPLTHRAQDAILLMIEEVVTSAVYLSNQRWGALIIIERTTGLQDIANKGIAISGDVSSALLSNIFVPNTPLHDGAVIIRNTQIIAAACILPLSDNLSQNEHFGTRHKAAVGISEQSDAVAVVVSEETGAMSVANNGRIYTKLDRETLRNMLVSLLQPGALRQEKRSKGSGKNSKPKQAQNNTARPTQSQEKPLKAKDTEKPLEITEVEEKVAKVAVEEKLLKKEPQGDETRQAIAQSKTISGTEPQGTEQGKPQNGAASKSNGKTINADKIGALTVKVEEADDEARGEVVSGSAKAKADEQARYERRDS